MTFTGDVGDAIKKTAELAAKKLKDFFTIEKTPVASKKREQLLAAQSADMNW